MSQSMRFPSFKHYWRIAVVLLLLCAPLSAPGFTTATGDVLTITASYNDMSSGRTWTAQKGGQQVGVQLTAPGLIPAGDFTQATEVSGIIASDTVWTLAGSPYIVTGNVLVQSGVQLIIEPGVQVRFNADRALQIDGELVAQGTGDTPIIFTSNVGTSPGDWGYILFSDSSTDATYDGSGNYLNGSIIQYAIIEYAGGANVSDNGAVRISASSPCIDHNTIRYNQANGVHVWNNAGPHITYNSIVDNGVVGVVNALGISVWESTATISYNTVARNTNTGIGFRVYNNGIISYNTVFDNAGMGISNYGSATINNNTVFGNTGTGISISYGPHTVSDNVVRDNIVAGDYGGIAAYGYYNTLIVERNVVIGNQATGKGGGIYATGTQANVYVRDNIIANNTAASNGGIYCDVFGQQGTVNNNVVAHNTVSGNGGGISFSECTIRNNAVIGNITSGNGGGVYSTNDYGSGIAINDNTIIGNSAAQLNRQGGGIFLCNGCRPTVNGNNLYDNISATGSDLYNGNLSGGADINAENSYWGTADSAVIEDHVWHYLDDSDLGLVDYTPYRTSHNTAAPISPPTGLTATLEGTSIVMSWAPNLESDLAGYKVYWDTDSGYPYAHSVGVGNVTAYTIAGITPGIRYYVTVTAYDTAADDDSDWTDGNESWFAIEEALQIWAPPTAAFTAMPLSGAAPLTITFTDQSTGVITAWNWDFGDGASSTLQNLTHTYTRTGSFTVTLTVSGPGGSDTEIKPSYITVGNAPPTAAFTAMPLSGAAPLTITFTDQSTGVITAWDWDFGDGASSTLQNPTHTYTHTGSFTVTLTVNGPGGSDTEIKPSYITVSSSAYAPPTASIDAITPNPAIQGQDTLIFNGSGHDNDEGGAYITACAWTSNLDGLLSTQEDFTAPAAALSAGAHTIAFKVQDDEGVWSPEVTRTLTVQAPQADVRTLILVNRQKLAALYSESEAAQVMGKLNTLASRTAVKGVVVQVENNAAVAAAYAVWNADPTNTAKANAVTAAIRNEVLAQWTAHPNLEYLVIVGDDRVIPFHRVLDQTSYPEHHYTYVACTSITGAALCADMTLTDDYYTDRAPTVPGDAGWDGHDLYIPDLGTGRLIETPAEIVAQIDAFLADGDIAAGNGIVTGYDFARDGAQAMCSTLSNDGLTTDCSLIGTSWTAAQFKTQVLNTRHDIVSINGHANHYMMGAPSGSVSSSEVAGAAADHTQAIFYTLGCHAGLNVPSNNPIQPLDLPQAFVGHRANYVANTGYGWGYVTSVGLSEQLMLDFTARLVYGQSATVGQALTAAKQEYYLNEAAFDYYDEKILIESTLYGLPMMRYMTPTPTAARHQAHEAGVTQEEQVTLLENGLTVNSISYQFPALLTENTDDGLYYTFGGLVHSGNDEPIQPKYTADLSFPQTKAHGVIFRGGVYTDVLTFNPVIDRVITETATLAEPAFSAPGWYPPLLHSLNRLERGDNLVTLLGQFNPQSQTERIYDRLSFDVYYHSSSNDWTPPEITAMSSAVTGGSASIVVGAEDISGIEAVVIAYTNGGGAWASVSLTQNHGQWSGNFPASADTVFLIQAVDNGGNVAVNDHEGQYFRPGSGFVAVYLPLVMKSN